MMYVEDLLRGLALLVAAQNIRDGWLTNFISNVTMHVNNGHPLSTKQSEIICKNASNHLASLAKALRSSRDDVTAAIQSPRHKQQPYASANIPREVRYLGMNKLAFRCKRDPTVVADIKALTAKQSFINSRSSLGATSTWHNEHRVWVVQVVNENLDQVFEVIRRHKFNFDQDTAEYLTVCTNSKSQASTFVMDDDEQIVYVNVCNNQLLAHFVHNLMNGQAL